jgi:thiamine-monophosphate kinase
VDEFDLIRRFFSRQETRDGVIVGVGDDGAIVSPEPGRNLVVVVDTLVAGVHYPVDFPAMDVGYRSLAVNLSDVAAMGGRPRWMTLALTLVEADETWLAGFSKGLFEAADQHGVALVGGDTTRGTQTVISVQLMGDVSPEFALTRSGARPGDAIYVTGTPGDAAGGLSVLQGKAVKRGGNDARYLVARFSRPSARVGFGAAIAGIATAAIDVSDGLGTDLAKLLVASEVSGVLDLDLVPLSSQMLRVFDRNQAMSFALDGGDDYELCFTAPAAADPQVMAIAVRQGVMVTRIGTVGVGTGLACKRDGELSPYEDRGYKHF